MQVNLTVLAALFKLLDRYDEHQLTPTTATSTGTVIATVTAIDITRDIKAKADEANTM